VNDEKNYKITTSQTNCQISNDIIRAMWAFLMFFTLVIWFAAYPKTKLLYGKHEEKVVKAKSQGKVYRLWHNSGFFSIVVFQFIGFPFLWAMCILKLADPNLHIGTDWAPTVLWWIVRFFVYFCTFTIQPALLASLLRGTRNLESIITAHRILSYLSFIGAVSAQFVILWPITTEVDPFNPQPGYYSLIIYGTLFGSSMIAAAAQALYIERKIVSALNQSIAVAKDDKTRKIKDKLSSMQSTFRRTMLLQATIFIFLAAAPFMWCLHDYFLPISWLAIGPLMLKSLTSIMMDEAEKKSGKKNKSSKPTGGKNNNNNNTGGGEDSDHNKLGGSNNNNNMNTKPNNQVQVHQKSDVDSSDIGAGSTVMHIYGLEENFGALSEQQVLEPPKKLSPAEAAKAKKMGRISAGDISEASTGLSGTAPGGTTTFTSTLGEAQNPLFDPMRRADEGRVEMRVSPAMRVLSMLTPKSRKAGATGKTPTSARSQKQMFFAPDSDDEEEDEGNDKSPPAQNLPVESREIV
jgi:hypothetical protein